MDKSSNKQKLQQIDDLFLSIIKDFSEQISKTISDSAGSLVDISSNYISKQTKDALSDFQKLYFGDAELTRYKEDINRGIDDILSSAQANKMDIAHEAINPETDELVARRTSLASIQRDLEKIITANDKTKQMVLPILESMQFEEILCNSLTQSVTMWEKVINYMVEVGDLTQDVLEYQLLPQIQQKDERQLFYEIVLEREFTEDHAQASYGENVVNR